MLSVLVDNSVIKTRADRPSDKERIEKPIEMYSFLEKGETDSKNSDVVPLYDGPKYVQRKKNTRCVLTSICLAVVIIGVIASLALLAYKLSTLGHGKKDDEEPVILLSQVNTTIGYISGVKEEGVHVFKGIPYAKPPLKGLRWKAPVPYEEGLTDSALRNMYAAETFPAKCFQQEAYYGEGNIGSEDCLYLNVWTPNLSSTAGLEVMVFIHGGGTETDKGQLYGAGLLSGSGHEGGMMPDAEIAKTGNIVFVSLNYRLGPFGFLALNVTDPKTNKPITGNYGFMDQFLALQWVNKNIRNFGGDPNKVTVFGVGAGATSIFALLASNKTKGLFQKAWLASPSPNFDTKLETAFKQNEEFLTKLTSNFDTPCHGTVESEMYSCLLDRTPDEIMNAVPMEKWRNPHFRDLPLLTEKSVALAIIDGTFLTNAISTVWHKGQGSFKYVHMLIGSSAQEVDDWPTEHLHSWSWDNYDTYVTDSFPPSQHHLAEDALKLYPHEISPEYQLTSMISDIRQVCGVKEMTTLIANKWVSPVYRYITTYYDNSNTDTTNITSSTPTAMDSNRIIPQDPDEEIPEDDGIYGITPGFRYAYHGIDMRHFFNEEVDIDRSKEDFKFVRNIRTSVFSFVKDESGIKGWLNFPENTTIISSQIKYSQNYKQKECELWYSGGFLPFHAWMN